MDVEVFWGCDDLTMTAGRASSLPTQLRSYTVTQLHKVL